MTLGLFCKKKFLNCCKGMNVFNKYFYVLHLDATQRKAYCLLLFLVTLFRNSHPEVFYKKGVLRNFAKFTGKYLCQILFFRLKPATLLKKRLWRRCFPVNFAKFLRPPFLKEHLRWLLLFVVF